jgi:aminoglycoside N3'-acetyltransferase
MMSGMAERAVIEASDAPRTRESIASDLRSLGVTPGGALLVHTAVSRLGWVCGGPVAVAQALLDVLGRDGTLVVPTHTTGNSDPAQWENPPVPAAWWPVIREHMPGFDPQITPSQGVGALPEVVRALPGALRSAHPQMSFAAIGPQAEPIIAGHVLESGLGEGSPLARLYDLDAEILLLGVGHASNTSLHLAEYRVCRATPSSNGGRRDHARRPTVGDVRRRRSRLWGPGRHWRRLRLLRRHARGKGRIGGLPPAAPTRRCRLRRRVARAKPRRIVYAAAKARADLGGRRPVVLPEDRGLRLIGGAGDHRPVSQRS